MRNYKIMISSIVKSFLKIVVDSENEIQYYINGIGNNTYFAKETREFRTIEEGSWYHLDGRYILCSENTTPYIYR